MRTNDAFNAVKRLAEHAAAQAQQAELNLQRAGNNESQLDVDRLEFQNEELEQRLRLPDLPAVERGRQDSNCLVPYRIARFTMIALID